MGIPLNHPEYLNHPFTDGIFHDKPTSDKGDLPVSFQPPNGKFPGFLKTPKSSMGSSDGIFHDTNQPAIAGWGFCSDVCWFINHCTLH